MLSYKADGGEAGQEVTSALYARIQRRSGIRQVVTPAVPSPLISVRLNASCPKK